MLEHYAQALGHFLQAHPKWGGILTFLISLLESLPIIGTIIPGSITMTAIGLLIGTSILPFGLTLMWAALGALIGDIFGFWFGAHYNERLRNMWPFDRHPDWLEAGKTFFHRHGGKSILIGRFAGPLRSIIPMIAGLMHMSPQKFLCAAIPAATLWALAYMLPGILLGALSSQLPSRLATKFILTLLLVALIIFLFAWFIKHVSRKCRFYFNRTMANIWQYLRSKPQLQFFTNLISNQNNLEDHKQLILVIISFICAGLFIITLDGVLTQNFVILFNKPVFEVLRSIRPLAIDRYLIAVTLLGDSKVLIPSATIIFTWFIWRRYYRQAKYWLVTIALAVTIPNIFKFFFYNPRPSGLLVPLITSSFPSGHTFFAVMYYGFLAMIFREHRTKFNSYSYYGAGLIIIMVAFSRLYLGAHWLTDVLASICLAYSLLSLITLSYRRLSLTHIRSIKQFGILTATVTLSFWLILFIHTLFKNPLPYTLLWPSKTVTENTWWNKINPELAIFRPNRLGKPAEPMNIQFGGNLQQMENLLYQNGWTTNSDTTLLKTTIQKLANQDDVNSFLPSLYLNNRPTLYMVKDLPGTKLILRLWHSNIYLAPYWENLYIGNVVAYYIDHKQRKIIYSFNAIPKLLPFLNHSHWQVNSIKASKLPMPLIRQNWQGEILQIRSPSVY